MGNNQETNSGSSNLNLESYSRIIQSISFTVSVVSIVAGIVFSVINYRDARIKDAESRKIEAAKPFLELRQKLYLEALHNAAVIATKDTHTIEEYDSAKKRFLELYWGELSLVEERGIEDYMVNIGSSSGIVSDSISETQSAVYKLSHVMRNSLIHSWGTDTIKVGQVNQ